MPKIHGVKQMTHTRYLNLYELDASCRSGRHLNYYVASRAKSMEQLKVLNHGDHADGVILYGVHGPQRDKLVLVRQYRYPLGDYVYEFPAGLLEPGEDPRQAGVREFYEETGMKLEVCEGGVCQRPFFTTVGMTDESCALCFGYCDGAPTSAHQEESEDIQVVLADRDECRRILREERVAVMCAYMMMHFIAGTGDPLEFLKEFANE